MASEALEIAVRVGAQSRAGKDSSYSVSGWICCLLWLGVLENFAAKEPCLVCTLRCASSGDFASLPFSIVCPT